MSGNSVRWFDGRESLDYQVAVFLASRGITRHPDDDQEAEGPLPAVFLGGAGDTPDRCVSVTVTGDDFDSDDACPMMTVQIMYRGEPWDRGQLDGLAAWVFGSMHDRTGYQLTAGQGVLHSRRVHRGPVAQDRNQRWFRVDVYRLRLAVPS